MRRQVLGRMALWGALAIGGALAALPATAQEFPKKQPIKIIVGANPGGGSDVMARITAEFLQKRLGQSVIVENKPGAGAAIAVDHVAKAPADGYTLLFIATELVVVPAVRNNLPYKFDELTYLISGFSFQPLMLGSPKFPISTTAELVAYMKANPGKVNYGSTGVGAIVHMGISMFESAAGVKGVHVPYTGIAPVYTDMLAGNIEITEATPPFVDGLKVLGGVGPKRNPAYPDIPTLEEIGIKGASWEIWFGFVAPPNLPKPIADKLIAEIGAVFKDPEAIAKYLATAKIAPETSPLTGEAFRKKAIEDYKAWKAVVEREKIVVQQ
jgi:tripartite-type tricarboxylate transporter receptor subunit TctC